MSYFDKDSLTAILPKVIYNDDRRNVVYGSGIKQLSLNNDYMCI